MVRCLNLSAFLREAQFNCSLFSQSMDNDKMIVPISKSKNEYDSLDIVL